MERKGKGGKKRGRATSCDREKLIGFSHTPSTRRTCPAIQACALTKNRTSNFLFCRMMPSPQSHTSQGEHSVLNKAWCQEKGFYKSLNDLEKRKCSTACDSSLPISPKGGNKTKLRSSCRSHSPEPQVHCNTET